MKLMAAIWPQPVPVLCVTDDTLSVSKQLPSST